MLLEDGTSYKYVFQSDRTNIMSYFKSCNFPTTHFSLRQVQRHYQVIETTKKVWLKIQKCLFQIRFIRSLIAIYLKD